MSLTSWSPGIELGRAGEVSGGAASRHGYGCGGGGGRQSSTEAAAARASQNQCVTRGVFPLQVRHLLAARYLLTGYLARLDAEGQEAVCSIKHFTGPRYDDEIEADVIGLVVFGKVRWV